MTPPPVVKSARETAFDYLKAAIVSGELQPGTVIDDAEVAKLCGTSRTPVREAVIQLEKVGLVHAPPRRRPTVAASSGEDVEQILALLGVLHALAAGQATPLATPADVDLMEELNDRLREAAAREDWDAVASIDMQFHSVLVNRTGNRFLVAEIDNLHTLLARATKLYMRSQLPNRSSIAQHEEIIAAIRGGDGDGASRATFANF